MSTDRLIIALDPGLSSGCSIVTLTGPVGSHEVELVESHELDVEHTWHWLESALIQTEGIPNVELVAETFIITIETAKKSQSPWSLRLLGVADYLAAQHRVPFIEQTPAQAKRLVTNDMLRAGGLWHKGGAGHANDATRHAVYRLLTTGWSGQGVVPV
jgi:hypothetical protein